MPKTAGRKSPRRSEPSSPTVSLSPDLTTWEAAASGYALTLEDQAFQRFRRRFLLRKLGPISGKKILDLGCASGLFARDLARRRARVVGLDGAPAFLEMAKRREARRPLGIRYIRSDLTHPLPFDSLSFDAVTALYTLNVLPRLRGVAREVFRVLRPQGRFLAVVPHPAFSYPVARRFRFKGLFSPLTLIRDYLTQRRTLVRILPASTPVVYYTHTIEDYISALIAAGFVLKDFSEPPLPRTVARAAGFTAADRLPIFLYLEAEKPKGS